MLRRWVQWQYPDRPMTLREQLLRLAIGPAILGFAVARLIQFLSS
jgi:hypothetical protein